MRITDYSNIAFKYDKNEYRQLVDQDTFLKAYIDQNRHLQYDILDLACGTGIYLYKQMELFNNNIRWYGLDASPDMLEKAREKVPNASLINGVAEDLPFESEKFDFIVNNYAFHHFKNKPAALDEITRVLKTNGILEMHNIAIHQMKSWWLYKYFPAAYFEDLKRFWDKDLIFHELSIRGFEVEINIKYQMYNNKISDLFVHAENKDISALTIIEEKEYLKGLEIMKAELYKDSKAKVLCDFAELYCICRKI